MACPRKYTVRIPLSSQDRLAIIAHKHAERLADKAVNIYLCRVLNNVE